MVRTFFFSLGPFHPVLQGIHQAMTAPEAFIKLTGKAGTGKTTVCETLCHYLNQKGYEAEFFPVPFANPEALRTSVVARLGLPDTHNFARLLETELLERSGAARPLVLIFDVCDQYSDACLLELHQLAQIRQSVERPLLVVMSGRPELDARLLAGEKFRALRQRISHNFVLRPLDMDALSQFVGQYFRDLDRAGLTFDPGAMALLRRYSQGLPGNALKICQTVARHFETTQVLPTVNADSLRKILSQAGIAKPGWWQGLDSPAANWTVVGPALVVVMVLALGSLYRMTVDRAPPSTTPARPEAAVAGAAEATPPAVSAPLEVAVITEPTPPAVSPFVDDQPVPVAQSTDPTPAAAAGVFSLEDVEEPVIDAGLTLVTALERGFSVDQLETPQFEALDATDGEPLAPVTAAATPTPATVATPEPAPTAVPAIPALVQATPVPVVATPLPTATPAPVAATPVPTVAQALVVSTPIPTATPAPVVSTPTPTATPAPVAVVESRDAVRATVDAWVGAWQAQDLAGYFGAYHTDFVPRYQDSVADWRANRERNIRAPASIELRLTEYAVVRESGEEIEVHFWLAYEAPSYRDETLKKLVLRPRADGWGIVEEVNLDVRR